MFHVHLKRMHTLGFFGCNVLKISIKSNCSIMAFMISVALTFCLECLSIHMSGMLKSPMIGVPIVVQWKQIQLVTMSLHV